MTLRTKPYIPISIYTISTRYTNFPGHFGPDVGLASAAWPGANRAIFVPIHISWYYPVKRVFWSNGTGTIAGNVDMGIYSHEGTLMYSTGSIAQSGGSANQFVTPSPEFVLSPGRYWFALASSSGTATFARDNQTAAATARLFGYLDQDSAFPLPSDMSGVGTIGTNYYPMFGVTRTPSGFAT